MKQYIVVPSQLVGNPEHWSTSYSWDRKTYSDRGKAITSGIDIEGHDDFCIGTLDGGKLVAYGPGFADFPADNRDPLAVIAGQIGLEAGAFDCGCPQDGRPIYACMDCLHARCEVHRDDPHYCPAKEAA